MNKRQTIALENYCRFAWETVNPKLNYAIPTGKVILCVAAGYE